MNGRVAMVIIVVAIVVALGIYVVRSTSDDDADTVSESVAPTAPPAGSGGGDDDAPSTTVAPTTTLDDEAVLIDAELEALLVDGAPAGFADADVDDRSLDLAAAVAAEQDEAAERSLLETRGFVRGRSRAWRTGAANALVTVYRFDTPEGAELYLTDGLITLSGYGAEAVPVPELDGAQGFTQEGVDGGEPVSVAGVTFTRGADWFLVVVAGTPEEVSIEAATALAVAQHEAFTPSTD
ncbi:MAG: hypothetical protein JJE52_14335 [Acidimicrobiia bacterium]|nr:hypothetical protein [Acidimicrobiia bacterium]